MGNMSQMSDETECGVCDADDVNKEARFPRSLLRRIHVVPKPPADAGSYDFLSSLVASNEASQPADDWSEAIRQCPDLGAFLNGVFSNAPYLRDLACADPALLLAILFDVPEQRIARTIDAALQLRPDNEAELMRDLRVLKKDLALNLGLADIGAAIELEVVTEALSAFADAALTAAIRFCLRDLEARGRYEAVDEAAPEVGSGLIVLAMGKHGAGELNYSSDIDLIVLYDPEIAPLKGAAEAPVEFVRLTKRVVKIMHERTADGYVFRTDLRLRPDPGATPLAISVPAALVYYESMGQNWERAALIKARPAAGDLRAGEAFLKEITPFIWRKYLDYAAIADVHSIKRQIHAHKGHGAIAVAGHNVKLGRGGIREVEFFVQTQQLIAGGRNPALRGRKTIAMLDRLVEFDWIEPLARDELGDAYRFLRAVEHRIQVINDEQTHILPQDEEGLTRIAQLLGFDSTANFESELRRRLETVQRHYAALFEDEPELASDLGNLVFTGDDDDPDTLETLARLGFKRPRDATKIIRAWHYGRYPAVRSSQARERLTELHPALIDALGRTDNADQALIAFDHFLSKLPAGVQMFSLLRSNPHLLNLLATVMGAAPRLAQIVSRRIHVLDAVLDPSFFDAMPRAAEFEAGLKQALSLAHYYEDALDRARIFTQEQQFLIGVRLLSDTLNAHQLGHAQARLAEVVVQLLFEQVIEHVAQANGRLKTGEWAVLAMGKLGGREMTAASDLDMIVLYDFDESEQASDGERPLAPGQYFIRLTQRLVAALSAPTAEGQLYEVDFRLRPSGNAGPLATRFSAFKAYQEKNAWTWEHMALTRSRVIACSSDAFRGRIDGLLRDVLAKPRDAAVIAEEVRSMRARIEKEKGTTNPWSLKQVAGGFVDIEFIAQYLQLTHGAEYPEILSQTTETALGKAVEAGVLGVQDSEVLIPAIRLYHGLMQVLRLSLDGEFIPEKAPRGVLDLLSRCGAAPDFARLESELVECQQMVREIFERLIGPVSLET